MLETAEAPAKRHGVASAAALVTVLSILSPATGLLLEVSLAWKFGASATVDAFRTAYLLIVFASQLFMGFLLPHVVVPLIAGYAARGDEAAGWRLAISFGQALTFIGLLSAVWVFLDPAATIHLLAPGLTGDSLEQSISLIRSFAFSMPILLWCGVVTGILYVHGIFGLPLLSQTMCNLAIASGVILLGRGVRSGIALGAASGFGAMLILHVWALARIARTSGIPLPKVFRPAPVRSIARVFLRSLPIAIIAFAGMGAAAIGNGAISRLPSGSLALFGYASKLITLVVFASAALSTVMFPAFSGAFARGDRSGFAKLTSRGIRTILLLTVPLTAFVFALRIPIVRAIFDRGALSPADLQLTAKLFGILLIYAPASAMGLLLLKIFFAAGDTRTPAVLHLVFPFVYALVIPTATRLGGGPGILIAFDAISWALPLGLLAFGIARYGIEKWSELGHFCVRLAVLSAAAGIPGAGIHFAFLRFGRPHFALTLAELAVACAVTALAVFFAARQLRIPEAREIEVFLAWRLGLRGPAPSS